jgi:inorganic pyrophosphatase
MAFPHAFFRWRPHPWHGLEVGPSPPQIVTAYVEITPFDAVKYEVDKSTGYIRVDRPQSGAAQPPTLYGFVPRTLCGERVARLAQGASKGDGDPLDICVVSERPITRADIIMNVRVLGGIGMIDRGEADDKIVGVLQNDLFWGNCERLSELPENLVARMRHYFSTYKLKPGEPINASGSVIYDREHAFKVIQASIEDYTQEFGG